MANVTILPEDYEGLKHEYLILRKELDVVNQDFYVCKRQLKVVEALQLEYQSEIEMLQSEENSQKLKQDEKVTQLEENISNIKSNYNERIQKLESKLTSKEDEIGQLKSEIEFLKKSKVVQSPTDDVNKLLDEITDLRDQNEVLLENEEELKVSLEILQKNNFSLEEALTEYKQESTSLKDSLSCKRDELMETNDLVQKLNDELFCLKSELETYKNKPLNAESKGNSLFAEVDDRRVYLQKTINSMKSEYIAMKQERAKHLNLISHLRKENKELCERWKMDIEEKEDDQYTVLKSYKDQIQILENLVTKYKQDLAAKPVIISTGTFDEIEFYQIMFNNKIRELEELRDQLKSRGLTHTILSTTLKEANKDIRKWRLEATLKQCQLELQPGDSVSENTLTKKVDDEMGERRVELKQTKKGPHLACKKEDKDFRLCVEESVAIKKEDQTETSLRSVKKEKSAPCSPIEGKEVITINDSADDVQIVETEVEEKEKCSEERQSPSVLVLKNMDNTIKTQSTEKIVGKSEIKEELSEALDISEEEKENVSEKTSRKVTFSQNTVSPKTTDRTALRRNCRRLVVPKPIYIPSE